VHSTHAGQLPALIQGHSTSVVLCLLFQVSFTPIASFEQFLCMFKMIKEIDNPIDCEVPSVICFLNAQNVRALDIHRQLTTMYGEGVMNDSSVRKWCRMFNAGRTNVHDEE
jgi:hypothetical protein